MYRNAKAEMVRAGLTLADIAPKMNAKGMTCTTLSMKLNGKAPITVKEAKQFKEIVGTSMSLEELFEDSTEEVG